MEEDFLRKKLFYYRIISSEFWWNDKKCIILIGKIAPSNFLLALTPFEGRKETVPLVAWILDEHVVALSLVAVKELSLVMLLRFVTFVTEPKYSYVSFKWTRVWFFFMALTH